MNTQIPIILAPHGIALLSGKTPCVVLKSNSKKIQYAKERQACRKAKEEEDEEEFNEQT